MNHNGTSTPPTPAHFDCDLRWQEDFYQHLHANPELSGHEAETAAAIAAKLADFECKVTTSIGGHGITAVFSNGPGATVLMRADFDALPVKETTGVFYASTKEMPWQDGTTPVMHACGHDLHVTALLGVCAMLDSNRDKWSGTFIALFQPSEENGLGALSMVGAGLGEVIPRPDVCFGQHVVAGRAGNVMSMPGAILAACDSIEITITGKSAHGSMPHASIDPTFAAAMIVIRLQGIVGREIPPEEFAVVSVGTLESGRSNNTIPHQARLVLNCRTYNDAIKAQLYSAIERVVRAECAASGIQEEPTFRYFGTGPVTDNSVAVFDKVRPLFDAHFAARSVTATPWSASEDFSHIPRSFDCPYLFWFVGATPADQWDAAAAAGTIAETIPVNHMGTFLPDFSPTVTAAQEAGLIATLAYLAR